MRYTKTANRVVKDGLLQPKRPSFATRFAVFCIFGSKKAECIRTAYSSVPSALTHKDQLRILFVTFVLVVLTVNGHVVVLLELSKRYRPYDVVLLDGT